MEQTHASSSSESHRAQAVHLLAKVNGRAGGRSSIGRRELVSINSVLRVFLQHKLRAAKSDALPSGWSVPQAVTPQYAHRFLALAYLHSRVLSYNVLVARTVFCERG